MKTTKRVLWTVGLSNGETLTEEKGNFQTITGELSPWQRLKSYIAKEGVTITSLSLYTASGMRWNIPSTGKNPKFHAFSLADKPLSYNMFRKMGGDIIDGSTGDLENVDMYTVIEAIYPDCSLQVWVDENTFNSWSIIL